MDNDLYEGLKLKNQICFPMYVCAKEITRKYKPYLDELDLTYTQYITMMVLWEEKKINVKDLGEKLFLDSGTLTPLLKKLEAKGYIVRERSTEDERNLLISISPKGEKLKDQVAAVPMKVSACVNMSKEKSMELYNLLYEIIDTLK